MSALTVTSATVVPGPINGQGISSVIISPVAYDIDSGNIFRCKIKAVAAPEN